MSTYIKHNAGMFSLVQNVRDDKPDYMSNVQKRDYDEYINSIPAIEIENPEVLHLKIPAAIVPRTGKWTYMDRRAHELKDNDTFLLPETVGYEISYQRFDDGEWFDTTLWIYDSRVKRYGSSEMGKVRKVARLYVKAEKGETQEYLYAIHVNINKHVIFLPVKTNTGVQKILKWKTKLLTYFGAMH